VGATYERGKRDWAQKKKSRTLGGVKKKEDDTLPGGNGQENCGRKSRTAREQKDRLPT